MPALGMLTCTPSAMTGSSPIGVNSVVPMANAPVARANNAAEDFIAASPEKKSNGDSVPGLYLRIKLCMNQILLI
ncbi:hypothetical protein FR5810_03268 [Bordetella pertussis]|nr:hypothetical protein FR5810_03268 [Bordetella pertussis]